MWKKMFFTLYIYLFIFAFLHFFVYLFIIMAGLTFHRKDLIWEVIQFTHSLP